MTTHSFTSILIKGDVGSWTVNASDCGREKFELTTHTNQPQETAPVTVGGKATTLSFDGLAVKAADGKGYTTKTADAIIVQEWTDGAGKHLLRHERDRTLRYSLDSDGGVIGRPKPVAPQQPYAELLSTTMQAIFAQRDLSGRPAAKSETPNPRLAT